MPFNEHATLHLRAEAFDLFNRRALGVLEFLATAMLHGDMTDMIYMVNGGR